MRHALLIFAVLAGAAPTACGAQAPSEGLSRAVRIQGPESKPKSEAAPEATTPQTAPQDPRLTNMVDLTMEMSPSADAPLGTRLSFRVGARKKGYVILVDVDATGRLTQIFPNFLTLAKAQGPIAESNQIPAKTLVTIPQAGSRTYEFVASAPRGIGMVMAIFSETPLEMVDLPDVPPELAGQAGAAEFLRDAANGLRIVPAEGTGEFQQPKLSFVAHFYVIR
ncbi:DUF4384 domain-containing protein [uncultured Rhodoblastus sp.]|uniref:DUF4384 domain-containing protein n=1 Tax=uncultured Rhodoblastus sp. TaxID=543037 RepID=UPI0025DEA4EC|nr:DUF4384 domain-containing protein [uncultured Rhodoblastus sp.]